MIYFSRLRGYRCLRRLEVPDAYSIDLRSRVVDAWEAKEGSHAAIAYRFNSSPSSVERWINLRRETSSLQPHRRPGSQHSRKLFDEHQVALKNWLIERPDRTLKELAQRLLDDFDVQIDSSQIGRTLNKMGWTRKKSIVDPRQRRPDVLGRRCAWATIMKVLVAHLSRVVFIDETALHPYICRRYGRSPRGERCVFTTRRPGRRNTLIAALGYHGPVAHRHVTGGINREELEAFLREDLLPKLQAYSFVVFDNLNIHTEPWVKELIKCFRCVPIYLPQYSPEFNPIELAFNKLKALIRGLHPQGVVAVREAFEWAWAQITPKNACAFFHECGLNPGAQDAVNSGSRRSKL